MESVFMAKRIDSPADKVWKMISGPELRNMALKNWVERIDVDGDGVGTILTTVFPGGATIKERIEKLDHEEREYSLSVIDSGPLAYAYYLATMRVQPCGDDNCMLSVRCNFIAEDGMAEKTREAWYASNTKKCELIAEYVKTLD